MKKVRVFSVLFCLLCVHNIFGQKTSFAEIDSLLALSGKLVDQHPDSALKNAFIAAEQSQSIRSSEHLAKSYSAIGRAYDRVDATDDAIVYLRKAMEVSESTSNEKLKAHALLEFAAALYNKGNFDGAFIPFRRAKTLAEKANDAGMLYEIYSFQGNIALNGNQWDTAAYYFNKSLAGALAQKDTPSIANSNRNISYVCFKKKQWDEGRNYLSKALEIYEMARDSGGIAKTFKDMGDMNWELKDNKKAVEYYTKAYDIQKARKNISRISVGACDLAYMYALDGRKDKLDQYADESYALAKQTKSWTDLSYSAQWLSEAYEKAGDSKKALFYHKVLLSVTDSITNRSRIEKNSRQELESGFQEKIQSIRQEEEKRKAIADERERSQKAVRNILISGMLVTLILLFIAYRSYVQKKKANVVVSQQKLEVEAQKIKIEEKNKEITDSINYAKLIQRSILPDPKEIMKVFPNSFGLYKPKDVVSGDFYWFAQKNNSVLLAAVDCTGHGVPGALMSMIGVDKLNEAVASGHTRPAEILSHLNKGVKSTLRQKESGSGSKDGMDIALISGKMEDGRWKMEFAGAQRPLWLIRNNELTEYRSSKVSIGGITPDGHEFISHEIKVQPGDAIYIFTDGFADQFGGSKGKKIMTKNFKETLLSIQDIPFLDQEKALDNKLTEWQGNFEQVDDILVIGIKI